jgi:hypothetical protein
MQHYRLLITGSLPLEFEDGEKIPSTPKAWQAFFEAHAIDPYALKNLTVHLVPLTAEEIAVAEAELQRKLLQAHRER